MTPRFAVYIAAHDKPALFADLVASLHHPQIDVYAHVDRAVDSRPFHEAVRAVLPEAVHPVRFVAERDRIRVNWGGISLVSASLRLLALSTGSGRVYHRHSLLSGTDLLLRSLPQLIDAWSGDVEFLRVDCALDSGPHRATVDRYHFPDHPSLRRLSGRIPRPPIERRLYAGPTGGRSPTRRSGSSPAPLPTTRGGCGICGSPRAPTRSCSTRSSWDRLGRRPSGRTTPSVSTTTIGIPSPTAYTAT
ncbi:beta-1,6-N-acetylglucosaminyltransferase [Gordonia polyisoprenivorans]|uniref:beta-1,6-N-acetylglucosaminyltransferase n=1 Tax=Gordonia polyisoprenivorans TaxID=84595 RepID=UPI001F0B36B2|nr:beta-1,6-N-acetylglucosaminyltransferase [Gordonia polyisoprenivorans]